VKGVTTGKGFSINVNYDSKCDECGKPGRCANGLCLACTTKAITGKTMKSRTGKEVQQRGKKL